MTRIILALALTLAPAHARAASIFRVATVEGGRLTADGQPAAEGYPLREGQELRLDKGRAVLSFGEEGNVLLKGPALFIIAERGGLLKAGGLLSVLKKLKSAFTIETPTAIAAVRGTNFFVEVRSEHRTYVCACKGTVEIRAAGGSGFKTVIKGRHHAPYTFSSGEKRLRQASAEMADHSDEEIADLLKRR